MRADLAEVASKRKRNTPTRSTTRSVNAAGTPAAATASFLHAATGLDSRRAFKQTRGIPPSRAEQAASHPSRYSVAAADKAGSELALVSGRSKALTVTPPAEIADGCRSLL